MFKYLKKIALTITLTVVALFIWFTVSLFVNPQESFTVLLSFFNKDNIISAPKGELLKGEKIIGSFKAQYGNLGIVSLRFNTYVHINQDKVIFRIKQVGSNNWYYQNDYKVDQFQPNQLFTFGFPLIHASKGKSYVFEVESESGKHKNAVALDTTNPVFVAKYQYTKSEIARNAVTLVKYYFLKLSNAFQDVRFYYNSLLYTFPIISITLWYIYSLVKKGKQKQLPRTIPYVVAILMIVESFLSFNLDMGYKTGILLMWLLIIKIYRFNGGVSHKLGVVFFIFALFLQIVGLIKNAEEIAMWAFTLMLIGIVQIFFFSKKGE